MVKLLAVPLVEREAGFALVRQALPPVVSHVIEFIQKRDDPLVALSQTVIVKLNGVTPDRVRVLIRGKRLPATMFGRNYMIKESDLQLVKNRKVGRPPLKKRNAA